MASDFNFSCMQWSDSCPTNNSYYQSLLRRIMVKHYLTQAVTQPTRGIAILSLMFVSDTLTIDGISYLAPINCSDHDSKLLRICLPCSVNRTILCCHVDYDGLRLLLSQTDWTTSFKERIVANDFAYCFNTLIFNAVDTCTSYKPISAVDAYLGILLLCVKKRTWRTNRQSGDIAPLKTASRTARAALRQYRRCEKLHLVYSDNRKAFFTHMHRKTFSDYGNSIHLRNGDSALSDQEAADILLHTFSSIFSSTVP